MAAASACGRFDFDAIRGDGGGGSGSDSLVIDGSTNQPVVVPHSTTLPDGAATATTNATYDLAHSALFFTMSEASDAAGDALVCGSLTPTSVKFERGTSGGDVPIEGNIVTWDGWSVVRGENALTQNQNQTDVAIPAVDFAHSFPVITTRVTGGTYGNDDTVRAELLDATTLRLSVRSLNVNTVTVCWQVITIPDATIVRETFQVANGDTMLQRDAPARYDSLASLFVYSYAVDNANATANLMLQGQAADDDQVYFSRGSIGGTIDVSYYAVQLAHGLADGGAYGFSDSQFSGTAPAGGIDTITGVPFFMSGGVTSDYLGDTNPGHAFGTVKPAGDTVTVRRTPSVANGQATIHWQRVQLVQ